MEGTICPICGFTNKYYIVKKLDENNYKKVNCHRCGNFELNSDVEYTYRYDFCHKLSCWIREKNDIFKNHPKIKKENIENIMKMNDKKINEKFKLMMNYLSLQNNNSILEDSILVKCWIKNTIELDLLIKKAIKDNLIEAEVGYKIDNKYKYPLFKNLTFDGLQYLEELEEPNKNSKQIFVAFNFDEPLTSIFNTNLKEAIEYVGFEYVVVNQDNVEHNKSINDEIIVKLKTSRIVIADFTNHRNSVYFEAGFAMGMNIPIIWTCQKGHENNMSFDTRQFPHIVWEDKNDLVKQVIDRIKRLL